MTKKQIENGCKKAVENMEDIQVCNAVETLMDYGLIDWKTRCAIYEAIAHNRKAGEEQSA